MLHLYICYSSCLTHRPALLIRHVIVITLLLRLNCATVEILPTSITIFTFLFQVYYALTILVINAVLKMTINKEVNFSRLHCLVFFPLICRFCAWLHVLGGIRRR